MMNSFRITAPSIIVSKALETAAGTGGGVTRTFDLLLSTTTTRFYIVAPLR